MNEYNKNAWQEIYDAKNNCFREGAKERLLAMDHAAVDAIKRFMQQNSRDIKANQLRNIHARIRQNPTAQQKPILRFKLAYIKGKSHHRSAGYHNLLELMDEMLTMDAEELKKLPLFFEAVLAYHKYYENAKTRR